jgi:LssY C-terminus
MIWRPGIFKQHHRAVLVVVAMLVIFGGGLFLYSLTKPSAFLADLPAVTKTATGHAGDPLNVVVIGNKQQLSDVFMRAHWLVPDSTNETTTGAIIRASMLNTSYPSAPVSTLYLFNRPQDQAFEYPTVSVRQRHHVRLWMATKRVANQEVWIGAASYDAGIELSGTNHLPTHHISPNIDAERTYLAKSLLGTGLVVSVRLERLTFPTAWGTNGGGDRYFDDVNAVVIQ